MFKKGFMEGPARDFSRTTRRALRAVSVTGLGAGGVRVEFHEAPDFYKTQTRASLRPATAVHLARSIINQLGLGYLQNVDVHDLRNIQKSIAMLIQAKEKLG